MTYNMKILQVLSTLFVLSAANNTICNCGWTNRECKTRIVGGEETRANEYPWMVALVEKSPDWRQYCGGSLITPWHVLTAGHCAYRRTPDIVGAVVGAHDLKEWKNTNKGFVPISKTILHEKYVDMILSNDIALMVTAKKVDFNAIVGPVCLPNRKLQLENQYVKAMGWGLTDDRGDPSNVLLQADLRVLPWELCKQEWQEKMADRPDQLCTRQQGKDSCNQDSGGPLVWMNPSTNKYTQVALVSFGDKCAGPKAAVNTDVSAYLDWINKQVSDTKPEESTCTGY